MNSIKNVFLAIRRNPSLFGLSLFLGLTTIWALLEPFVSVYFKNPNKYYFLIILLVPSLIIAIVRTYPKNEIVINLQNTNTLVRVKFGNILEENGCIAISVNEYFDSKIGKIVSPNSLHGYLIKNILGGKSEIFDKEISVDLNSIPFENCNRKEGKTKKFPIGTTTKLEFGDKKYLLFALAKTNENYEAYTTPSLLLEALDGLFLKSRSECNGENLNLALVGTGLSRSGIPAKNIIDLIFIGILKASKERDITKEINIVIQECYFKDINLNEIKRKWK